MLSTILSKGTSPSVGIPNFGTESPTSSGNMPNYPPGKLPPPFGMGGTQMPSSGVSSSSLPPASVGAASFSTAGSGVGGPGAAAAAAVLEAVNSGSRYPSTAQGPGPPYGNPQDMMMMGAKVSDNMSASGMSPMQLGSMMGANVQTGLYNVSECIYRDLSHGSVKGFQ